MQYASRSFSVLPLTRAHIVEPFSLESVLAPDQEHPIEEDDYWNDDVGRSLRVASVRDSPGSSET